MASEQDQTTPLSEQVTATPEVVTGPLENTDVADEEEGGEGNFPLSMEEETEIPIAGYDDEEEDFTLLSSSPDNPDNARDYAEYKRLLKAIKYQNATIEGIKSQIQKLNCKNCLDTSERKELKSLYDCLELEMDKIRYLMNAAIHLQNFGSHRRYREIDVVTTFDEDKMEPIPMACDTMPVRISNKAAIKSKSATGWRASGGDTTSDLEKSCSYQNSEDFCASEAQKLMKDMCAALQTKSDNSRQNPCKRKSKDEAMGKLKQRIRDMQLSIDKLNEEICRRNDSRKAKEICGSCIKTKHKSCPSSNQAICPSACSSSKAQQFQRLKDNYMYLLKEFSKKEGELKEITKRLKNSCGSGCGTGGAETNPGYNADASEIHLLTNRVNDLKEEQIEFKCLMREQSSQLEDYRNKYLTAQQKVEEQCALIEKLNMNNKRIEKQINLEVKEIRCKFQEKLNELLQYPKLLENEQIKVVKLCKEKEDLENKLMIVCKELKSHKNLSENKAGGEVVDCKPQLQKCQQELHEAKKTMEDIQRQRSLYCEQLKETQEDLDCLRSESAKIIARLKERCDLIKNQQQEHIDRLEKQLAQCRATACLSVSDRECVIREMQGQLNTLSYSFDSAQKQIKTLRNHIAYMSNENCFPAKC